MEERKTLYAVTPVVGLASHVRVATVFEGTATPAPETAMVTGELAAVLATMTLPAIAPAVVGAKVTVTGSDCPGLRVTFVAALADTPAPEKERAEIATLALPVFDNVRVAVAALPTETLPKFSLVVLAVIMDVELIPVPLVGTVTVLKLPETTADPLAAPAVAGEKPMLKVVVVPGPRVTGSVMPPTENPVPVAAADEMVRDKLLLVFLSWIV